jgi:hypothetical protein
MREHARHSQRVGNEAGVLPARTAEHGQASPVGLPLRATAPP